MPSPVRSPSGVMPERWPNQQHAWLARQPPGAGVAPEEPASTERVDPHCRSPTAGSMDEATCTDVDTNVEVMVEEDEIARLEFLTRDGTAELLHKRCRVRKLDVLGLTIDPHHETRSVEAGLRRCTAPHVRHASLRKRHRRNAASRCAWRCRGTHPKRSKKSDHDTSRYSRAPEPHQHQHLLAGLCQILAPSGVRKSWRVGPSGAVARLNVVVPLVTHQASDRVVCVLGMNRPGVHGDAGLAPAVGLIRSLSALGA